MITIWKYAVEIDDVFKIEMPRGAEILTVQIQDDVPCMWAKVDSTAPIVTRHFGWYGTGHLMRDPFKYIGTIQRADGGLVFHLFEEWHWAVVIDNPTAILKALHGNGSSATPIELHGGIDGTLEDCGVGWCISMTLMILDGTGIHLRIGGSDEWFNYIYHS
jgi:hypothetical protein